MCGIAGLYSNSRSNAIQRMATALQHRGPNDFGIFTDELVALAQSRLAIIDTTSAGHQPMGAAEGLIQIVYNGEMYNFQAERAWAESKGCRFRTESDTEVILKLYELLGVDFLKRLRGMFALAIYDKRDGRGKEKLLLARDQFGIKPLLYSKVSGGFVFASELKALLASGLIPHRVDSFSLQQLLSLGSIYQPRTMIENVMSLPPGHFMWVEHSGIRLERYWNYALDRIDGLRQASYEEQVDRFHEVIKKSVELQMIADVPVGAFLSGGVDSSLIVALMAEIAGDRVKTYSVGFEDGAGANDETHEAAEIARVLGTDHTTVVVTAADMLSHLDRFIMGIDQPSVDGLNTYFVSHAASQGVTVSLSGTGGDELFMGYPWFANILSDIQTGITNKSVSITRKIARKLFLHRDFKQAKQPTHIDASVFCEAFGRQYHCFGPMIAHELLAKELRQDLSIVSFADNLSACDELLHGDLLDRASVMCLNGYTRNQLLRDIDACSMTHSLEVRVPFLDVEVANFALSLPVSSKLIISEGTFDPFASYAQSGIKRIVCDVARRYLPASFFDARSKRGFILPYADWLKGPLAEILEDTLSWESVTKAGLFDPAAVQHIYKDFLVGQRPWLHPWLLMVIELWRRKNLE